MASGSEIKASILVVDDKPERVLAIAAVLEDLQQEIVKASSGKEALRCLLKQDFAVILLDVNMPGMDGFETAALIRQRSQSRRTPIIFITAFGDEMHMAQGYSLGAVDYILAPVVPDVLRTKVMVFVDLYKKTEEVKRQTRRIEERAEQLHRLSEASLAIHSAPSIEATLQVVAGRAREIIGAHQGFVVSVSDRNWFSPRGAASFSDAEGGVQPFKVSSLLKEEPGPCSTVCRQNRPLLLSSAEMEAAPGGQGGPWMAGHPPRGFLGAPLHAREGKNTGLIFLTDRLTGEFNADDQALLLQLAQVASIAIENALSADAREANRLKDEFLATLSHELRTPLNAILGWTQLLGQEELSPDERSHGLSVIERNVKAQGKLIEDLLDVSRISTGKMRLNRRPVSLSTAVQGAIDGVRPSADARELLILSILPSSTDEVLADPDRLQQVFWNLLSNAVKFTPHKGRIEVAVERLAAQWRIRVIDNGQGMSPEFLPHVFDRFRQADSSTTRAHGGLGIGLTIVRHIVELHGGSVEASSEGPGRGSTFTVMLPVPALEGGSEPAPARSGLVRAGEAVDADLAGLRVVIVDDEPDARDLLSRTLTRLGVEVLAVGSAAAAFEALGKFQPHVLVCDIAMPEEDGYSLIRRVRLLADEQRAKVPAIAVTAFAREEDRLRALSAGFQMYATKPIEPSEFVELVAVLGGRLKRAGGANGGSPPKSSDAAGAV
jgi:signal transduction histidine kinase/DNA-binding response OmpR family regulator